MPVLPRLAALRRTLRDALWAERAGLVLGFGLTAAAALAGPFYLGPAQRAVTDLDDAVATGTSRLRILRAAQGVETIVYGLGGLVFSLPADAATPDGTAAIKALQAKAFELRHDNVRTYIGGLGLAGVVDRDRAAGEYEALVEAEHRHLTLATFQATSAYESHLSDRAVRHVGQAPIDLVLLAARRKGLAETSGRRDLLVLALSTAGAVLLLLVTLAAAAPAPSAEARLARLALAEARRRLAPPTQA